MVLDVKEGERGRQGRPQALRRDHGRVRPGRRRRRPARARDRGPAARAATWCSACSATASPCSCTARLTERAASPAEAQQAAARVDERPRPATRWAWWWPTSARRRGAAHIPDRPRGRDRPRGGGPRPRTEALAQATSWSRSIAGPRPTSPPTARRWPRCRRARPAWLFVYRPRPRADLPGEGGSGGRPERR